ncbi:MAG: nitronate monooxygenase, partial [Verrucomicrobia bacterium]
MQLPRIIQDGVDAMVATWPLARAVARTGQLGMVSGPLLPVIVARRLQDGDPGGHLRTAFEHFPWPGMARRVWEEFFRPGGRSPEEPYAPILQPHLDQGPALTELAVLAGFAEVFLARQDHTGPVGIHFATRARLPLLPTLYGALLAQPAWISLRDPDAAVLDAVKRLAAGERASVEAMPDAKAIGP